MKTGRKIQLKKVLVLTLILVAAVATKVFSQTAPERNSIGLRIGSDPGITYKGYFNDLHAMELMLHTGYRGLMFTGLYEFHIPVAPASGVYFYLGPGAHIGTYDRWIIVRRGPREGDIVYVAGRPSAGVDGIFGIEWRIPTVPLNLAFDMKPSIDFYDRYAYGMLDAAISFRFRF